MFDRKVKIFNFIIGVILILAIVGLINLSESSILNINLPLAIILLMVMTFVISVFYTVGHERRKMFEPGIRRHLQAMGYSLLRERPLTIEEGINYLVWTPRFTTFVNEIPIERFKYRSRNYRILIVRDDNNHDVSLCVAITTHWDNEIELNVLKKIE